MPLAALVRALAIGDDQATRRTILSCGEALRESRTDAPDALVAALLPLTSHPSPTLRQALADVCDAFPDAIFDEAHARLLADGDPYVSAAAEAAGHRHVRARRHATKSKGEEKLVADALSALDASARRIAERAVERGIEHFTAHLAHEVGKTQAPILRALAKLEADLDRPERSTLLLKDEIATIRERSQFAFSMIRRARDYTERGKPVFRDESLAPLVREARAQLADRLGGRAAKLTVRVDLDPSLRITADRYLLLQALQNVLQNAAESYDERAERLIIHVTATVRRGGSEVVLVVADEGVGIADELLETLFVPFGSRKPGGTGLGLLIVRRAIEEVHGGKLAIESAPGKGTRVTMVLPAKQAGG